MMSDSSVCRLTPRGRRSSPSCDSVVYTDWSQIRTDGNTPTSLNNLRVCVRLCAHVFLC